MHFTVLGLASLLFWLILGGVLLRRFRYSLLRDVPLLRLLVNTGPQGRFEPALVFGRVKKRLTAPAF